MELIPKNKIEEAAHKSSHSIVMLCDEIGFTQVWDGFEEGANFAINEMPDLFCEFGKYCFNMARNPNDKTTTFEQLFELWMKERGKR